MDIWCVCVCVYVFIFLYNFTLNFIGYLTQENKSYYNMPSEKDVTIYVHPYKILLSKSKYSL